MPHGGFEGVLCRGAIRFSPISYFSPPFLSPAELPCHPCLSPLACSPRLPASSIFPMVITSHNDVAVMSPRCTPNAGPRPCLGAMPRGPGPHWCCAWLVRAASCCRFILESICPCEMLPRCVSADSHPCNEPAGLSSAPFGRLGPSFHPWGRASPRTPGRDGQSIAMVGRGGVASPHLEFQCLVAEHPSFSASAQAPQGAA